jgi:predicted dehydrogenase
VFVNYGGWDSIPPPYYFIEKVIMKKAILVGIGGFANAWIPVVTDSQEIEFAGFVEIDPQTIQQQVKRYGFKQDLIFTTLEVALAAVEADGVINITPPAVHKSISLTALDAGVPVLSEKPLADSMASAHEIVQKSTQTGILHMVAQDYRYKAPIQTVKKLLDSGELGQATSVRADFYKSLHVKGSYLDELPYPLLMDMSIHHFDLMRFFLESNLSSVCAYSWKPAWNWFKGESAVSSILKFENKIIVTYNANWCGTGQETTWDGNWRFDCENGVILLIDEKVFVHRKLDKLEDMGGYSQYANEELVEVPLLKPERVGREQVLHEFYKAISTGREPATSCQDNIKSLEIVFRVIEAAKSWK